MYCPDCGAPEQAGRFCSSCGESLPGAAPKAAERRVVNVTVNVGAPMVISPSPSPGPSTLSRVMAGLARAAVQNQQDAARRREQMEVLQNAVRRHLTQCDDMIASIEGNIALDLLPHELGVRERYVRALEVRRHAVNLCDRAKTVDQVITVNDHLRWVLQELHNIWSATSASKPL